MKKFDTKHKTQDTGHKRSRKTRKGFTLMEVLIVAGITIVIAGIGISSYVGQQKTKLLDNTAKEIVGYLRYAQQKSISQEEGSQWGVHFENSTDGRDFYALYTGETYSSPTETKYLPAGITFQTPTSGNSVDMSFEKLIGFLSGETYQQIILQDSSGKTKNVLTCKQGLISYDEDIDICAAILDETPPIVNNITAYNISYESYVDSPFDLSADISEEQGGLLSCEYTINDGTDWYLATIEGFGPSYTCIKTGITSADGASLTLNMRATSGGGTGAGTSILRTVDAVAPTCSDNWVDNWTASSTVDISISCSDAKSGVAFTRYCVDTENTCSPSTSYTEPVAVSCASGSVCTQYIRYYAQDNVSNISSIYSKTIRQDRQAPADGTLSADPGNARVSLSWTVASDTGSGLAEADTYKLVFSTSDYPDANCATGSQIYLGTDTSYSHTDLVNDTTYYYRVCAQDAVNNMSTGSTALSTPHLLSDGETCSQGSDCVSGHCYVDEDGDRYAPASGTKRCQPLSQLSGVDCCDSDANTYPGQTSYFSLKNNCDSWDYDCDEVITKSNCTVRSASVSGSSYTCYISAYEWGCSNRRGTCYANCSTGSTSELACGNSGSYQSCVYRTDCACCCYDDGSCAPPGCCAPCYLRSTSERNCVCK